MAVLENVLSVAQQVIIHLQWQGGAGNGGGSPGGLLIIYGKSVINNASITSNGTDGSLPYISTEAGGGGGSGGGSINIFYSVYFKKGNVNADGGGASYR